MHTFLQLHIDDLYIANWIKHGYFNKLMSAFLCLGSNICILLNNPDRTCVILVGFQYDAKNSTSDVFNKYMGTYSYTLM